MVLFTILLPVCFFFLIEWTGTVLVITENNAALPVRQWIYLKCCQGPKFRPQSTKEAEIYLAGLEKSGAEFFPDLSKRAEKGPNFF
jgi:hypothetical protein